MLRRTAAWAFPALLLMVSKSVSSAEPDLAGIEFFEAKIRPVLVAQCQECHSSTSKSLKGGLQLDHRDGWKRGGDSGPAIESGQPEASLLLKALKYDGLEMPPKGKLPANVIADFEQWIKLGAPDPRERPASSTSTKRDFAEASKLWSFQLPQVSPLPAVKQGNWVQRDLDRFVLARLEQQGLAPGEPADRRTLLRRATFDLIGLPPSPEELETFLNDQSPQAFATVVERLLESPHYGERWGRHWLDVARYGEDQAHTFKARNYPQGYRYRDWVVSALNRDMPYDRFVAEQIAGDLIGDPSDPLRLAALGLFALGPVYYQDNGEQAKALADEWDDRIDTLTRGVLGLTVSCARCHDHKFDPITTADYYGLAGIFASSDYQERPIVPQAVLDRKSAADSAMKAHQLQLDRFLDDEARKLRATLVTDIPQYMNAAWIALNRLKDKPKDKKILAKVAKEQQVSELLLKRWVDYLTATGEAQKSRPYLANWYEWFGRQDPKQDLSANAESLATVQQLALEFQSLVQSKLPLREPLFARFGENVAFVNATDRAVVVPGVIPLGNLFDDSAEVSLQSAISTDKFGAAASNKNLGIDRVVQGWGNQTQIAGDIHFEFTQLGSDGSSHGAVINDGWDASGGIQTLGKSFPGNAKRTEQGIGMHANVLITFDLDKLRQAGLLPVDQRFVFRADRAGLNDDTFGSGAPSAHLAVIVSRPHRTKDVYDGIIAGYVNGRPVKIGENDRVYYFAGETPKPLKADGKFASFEVPIPGDARYLTLVSTGAGNGAAENTINSDHTVFSGARLEQDPLPTATNVADTPVESIGTEADQKQARLDANLLSELLYDEGLLAIPGNEVDKKIPESSAKQLAELRADQARLKQEFDAVQVAVAHSLMEATGRDLKIYLQGNPAKQGDVVPRSLPVVLTGGERKAMVSRGSGRAELAHAITSRDNPLTARVIVNRVWRGHFGAGLVRTPSNFGQLGDRPTHPELLDTLAVKFMDSGWSLKWLHREIMLSATYQQSSAYRSDCAEVDPENHLLWRMNRRRLEVEPWRDSMLAVTGELDRTVGGPPVDLASGGNKRRTVYAFISRHQLNDLLRLFDFPDPNITSDRRSVTTVPLQQLFVLNSDFMTQRAKAMAARLNSTRDATDAAKIHQAFISLYSRPPTSDELNLGLDFLSSTAPSGSGGNALSVWEQYALALLGTNEFSFVD
ncbi:MAG: DUF1553 domain-containing protein [Planctomycetes bacterium]|nr:DUF1553 domain-containing protein [Planctomycetota bacterium]